MFYNVRRKFDHGIVKCNPVDLEAIKYLEGFLNINVSDGEYVELQCDPKI